MLSLVREMAKLGGDHPREGFTPELKAPRASLGLRTAQLSRVLVRL